jgi:hypothetical protein
MCFSSLSIKAIEARATGKTGFAIEHDAYRLYFDLDGAQQHTTYKLLMVKDAHTGPIRYKMLKLHKNIG